MTHHTAAIYLRRSYADADRPGTVSHEKQEQLARDLAARHGYEAAAVRLYSDWGKSGGAGKERRRIEYLALKTAIAAGEVTDLFSYDQSRLTRSVKEWADLADLCATRGVKVHLVHGGTTDFSTATGKLVTTVLAAINEFIRDIAVQHKRETDALKRQQNVDAGRPERDGMGGRRPYGAREGESVKAVVDAFNESGSYWAAAVLLNKRGVPTRTPGGQWHSTSVRRILNANGVLPKTVVKPRRGAKVRGDHRLAGLLRCPCGAILTTMPIRDRHGTSTRYLCNRARLDTSHPKPYGAAEAAVLPWVKGEVDALIDSRIERIEADIDRMYDISRLAEHRERIGVAFTTGMISAETARAQQQEIDAQAEALYAEGEFANIPTIDWAGDPAATNRALQVAIEGIRMELVDGRLTPVEVVWRIKARQEEVA